MSRWMSLAVCAALAAGCGGAAPPEPDALGAAGSAVLGNGAPSGGHDYQLNIIGVPKGKSPNLSGGEGRRIFVPLYGTSKILLSEGAFDVLDANGTDGAASFQLPGPDPDNDGVTRYTVWARALGKPDGSARMRTCATEVETGELWCNVDANTALLVRSGGKSRFENVSRYLLYVYADTDGDGTAERYPLFDDAMEDYYWNYENSGLKLAQLRFFMQD